MARRQRIRAAFAAADFALTQKRLNSSQIKIDFYVERKTSSSSKRLLPNVFGVCQPFDEHIVNAAYVTADSLIVAKLRAFENSQSTRHLDDIASIIRIQKANLDNAKIEIAAAQLGLLPGMAKTNYKKILAGLDTYN